MIAVIKKRTPREMAAVSAYPGRKPGRLAGGFIHDLAALGKAIVLCPGCAPKFDAAKIGYVTKRDIPIVRGQCDGCRGYSARARLFLKGV